MIKVISSFKSVILVVVLLMAMLFVVSAVPVAATDQERAPALQDQVLTHPYVSEPVSPADTRSLPPALPPLPFHGQPQVAPPVGPLPGTERTALAPHAYDPVVQLGRGAGSMPDPIMNFEGVSATGVYPPDTNGQVGPQHYVQIVNTVNSSGGAEVRVWDKGTGAQLYDFGLGNLWPGGDACHDDVYGDPVVLYDQLADRWLLTHFALPSPPYYECIAVSKTGVPTNNPNDWYLYSFLVSETKMNDYPKLAIWPDGYYMSANQFTVTWAGAGVWVFDRDRMLAGQAANFQYFDLETINPWYGSLLPSNLAGSTLPPAGAPNYFMSVDMDWVGSNDVLHIFEFHTDWNDTGNTTFGLVQDLTVAPFDWNFDGSGGSRDNWDIPQPGTLVELDSLSDRLMMHLWYRNFGTHESLVVNHTVNVGSTSDHAGIRWYEIRGGTVDTTLADASIYQQGTYAPDDEHRWMGSIAMDAAGDMALGYSVSSSSVYPSVRYAGRLVGDPLGELTQSEKELVAGSGYQGGEKARWGDYSSMSVDPVDDCTFWYTQEYIQTTGDANWQTRVGSFVFPGCLPPPELAVGKKAASEQVEAGTVLAYTIAVTNTGGPATGVVISDTVPADTLFAWADHGGSLVGDEVVWDGLVVPPDNPFSVSFGVTVTCVPSGTEITNDDYVAYASEWTTPTHGAPLTVTAAENGVVPAFHYPAPVLVGWPVRFNNLSQNATAYEWDFGDGSRSTAANPTHTYDGPTGEVTVVLTATNACTGDTVSHTLVVHDYDVMVSPTAAVQDAYPGETVSYTLRVKNTGTLPDTFGMLAQDALWDTGFSANSLTLGPGEEENVTVQVQVPPDAEGKSEDVATIVARSQSDPRSPAAQDSAVLTTEANTVYGVEMGPGGTATAFPGETVTYMLVVTNSSNVVDTITLACTTSEWPTTVSPASLSIPRGESREVQVLVAVPPAVTGGETDVAVVRATGSGGYAETSLTTAALWRRTYLPLVTRDMP
jgi:uncharacterized repeat protein (TIGR01451 family)